MKSYLKYFSACLLATAALLVGASAAWAQVDFAVLANAAVTCTNGSIIGDVGTNQAPGDVPPGSVTQTTCTINGVTDDPNAVHVGDAVAKQAFKNFLSTYADLAPTPGENCTLLGSTIPASTTLSPGTYCTTAALTVPDVGVTLTLNGQGVYIFKIGTGGTGALTGTGFKVALAGGATACNVTWWVSQAATMTDSDFNGSILAGAAIETTRGTFNGDAFAKADVTITGTAVTGCEGGGGNGNGKGKGKCNQGVGNGPENCDPGNSNQDGHGSNPFDGARNTNDELGGTPGNPGRKGGNIK